MLSIAAKRFVITCDNDYKLYFDGVEQTNVPNHANWGRHGHGRSSSKHTSDRCGRINTAPGFAGILASTTDGVILTNSTWRCSNISSVSWADVDFDDSSWTPAVDIGQNGVGPWGPVSSINGNAMWIWNNRQFTDLTIHCRLDLGEFSRISNSLKNPCFFFIKLLSII